MISRIHLNVYVNIVIYHHSYDMRSMSIVSIWYNKYHCIKCFKYLICVVIQILSSIRTFYIT